MARKKKRDLTWKSDLDACDIGDYQVIPLTNSQTLRQEGRAMCHCVGTYVELCSQGLVRIFSIQDLMSNRLATLSLIFTDGYWHLEQIKGVLNAEVCVSEESYYDGEQTHTWIDMTDMHYVAYEVLRYYRKAWERAPHLSYLEN